MHTHLPKTIGGREHSLEWSQNFMVATQKLGEYSYSTESKDIYFFRQDVREVGLNKEKPRDFLQSN